MMNFGASFKESPSAEQVADIYARLSGKAPLLWEDQVNLPTVHAFDNANAATSPLLVELRGGALPKSAVPAIRVPSSSESTAPHFDEVVATLRSNGIHPETKTVKTDSAEARELLSNQDRPLVILHSNDHIDLHTRRILTSSSNSTAPISEAQISQYQICLWTGVVFVLLIGFAICSIVEMDVVPDNILFAKFQSGRTEGNKRD
eukprot:gene5684-4069_t